MSQQRPFVEDSAYLTNVPYIRRLFIETGYGWVEVANSLGKAIENNVVRPDRDIARIVEEYTPPSPSTKVSEIKLANSQSIIHGTGKSSYKIQLRLLFPDNITYSNFVFYIGNGMRYYDERGGIYQCALQEQPEIKRAEAGRRYDVKVPLIGVKKEVSEFIEHVEFTDLEVDNVHVIEFTNYGIGNQTLTFNFIGMDAYTGININRQSYYDEHGVPFSGLVMGAIEGFLIPMSVVQQLKDAGYGDYFGIDYNYNKVILVPKHSNDAGIVVDVDNTQVRVVVTTDDGKHWAYADIVEGAQAGLVSTQDGRGNPVYTFRPEAKASRAEAVTIMNNARKWIERMIRG